MASCLRWEDSKSAGAEQAKRVLVAEAGEEANTWSFAKRRLAKFNGVSRTTFLTSLKRM